MENKEHVNHPEHYQFGKDKTYEVIKIIEVYGFDFHLGNNLESYLIYDGIFGSHVIF